MWSFWHKMFGSAPAARGFRSSLLRLAGAGLLAFLMLPAIGEVSFEQVVKRLALATSTEQKIAILERDLPDEYLRSRARELREKGAKAQGSALQTLIEDVRKRASVEAKLAPGKGPAAAPEAQQIKRNPAYTDRSAKQTSSWIGRAFENLANLFRPRRQFDAPDLPTGPNLHFGWVVPLMWGILAGVVALLAFLVIRHFRWQIRLKRKTSALLEEDEPERTLDEWLELADKLQREGDFRGAVRALYLACLIRFDEAGIVRFNRRETNWEHLARLDASPTRPHNFDFLSPTRHFDRVWYGRIIRGSIDVDEMRQVYFRVVAEVTPKVA